MRIYMLVTEHQELKLREGKNFFKKGKAILSDAGFNLRRWVIICRKLQAYFDENKKSFGLTSKLKKLLITKYF